jgi:uncharacterized surface protein with fasciclin (FAS1) repeats
MTQQFARRDVLRLGAGLAAVTGLSACVTTASATPDIVDTAVAAGSFTTLVAAVQAAGLVDTLKSPGPFTVFAPTDAAFAALARGHARQPADAGKHRAALTTILTYHVVPGRVPAAELLGHAWLPDDRRRPCLARRWP